MKVDVERSLLRLGYAPDRKLPLKEQNPDVLLGMMILGEAGGESFKAKLGAACVARNRVMYSPWPNDWTKVLTQRRAFQGLMPVKDFYKTFDRRTSIDNWMECMVAGQLVMFNDHADVTGNSVFFIDYTGTKKLPKWLDWKQLRAKYRNLFFFGATSKAVRVFLSAIKEKHG